MAQLLASIEAHRERVLADHDGQARQRRRLIAQVTDLVKGLLSDRVEAALAERGGLAQLAESILAGERDPYSAAEELLATIES